MNGIYQTERITVQLAGVEIQSGNDNMDPWQPEGRMCLMVNPLCPTHDHSRFKFVLFANSNPVIGNEMSV